jgi:hypothetical protein
MDEGDDGAGEGKCRGETAPEDDGGKGGVVRCMGGGVESSRAKGAKKGSGLRGRGGVDEAIEDALDGPSAVKTGDKGSLGESTGKSRARAGRKRSRTGKA